MAKITAEPEKMINISKSMKNSLNSYESTYKKLISVIEKNEARLDKTTQESLLKSYEKMYEKYKSMSEYVKVAAETSEDVGKEFKRASANASKKIGNSCS